MSAIQATDTPALVAGASVIIPHLRGGLASENFHTIDHCSHAVWLGQYDNHMAATTRQFLLENWANLGRPHLYQFDNKDAFCGRHTHARIIGQVMRRCHFCGIEPLFTPLNNARRNYQIETFHSL